MGFRSFHELAEKLVTIYSRTLFAERLWPLLADPPSELESQHSPLTCRRGISHAPSERSSHGPPSSHARFVRGGDRPFLGLVGRRRRVPEGRLEGGGRGL